MQLSNAYLTKTSSSESQILALKGLIDTSVEAPLGGTQVTRLCWRNCSSNRSSTFYGRLWGKSDKGHKRSQGNFRAEQGSRVASDCSRLRDRLQSQQQLQVVIKFRQQTP